MNCIAETIGVTEGRMLANLALRGNTWTTVDEPTSVS